MSSPGEDRRLAYVRAYGRLNELVRLYLAGLMDRDWLACRREAIEQELEASRDRS